MKGVVLPGVVGEQDVVDVVVGLARQLELGESVIAGVVVLASLTAFLLESVLLREFCSACLKSLSPAVRYPSSLRISLYLTSVAARTGVTNKPAKARAVTFFLLIMIVL